VPDTDTFNSGESRDAFLVLEELDGEGNPMRLMAFITDSSLPKSSDHTQLRIRLMTPAEWDSNANMTLKNKD
jgi:hypothetical protein